MKFYFIIPSCNGEIIDKPYIVYHLTDIFEIECIIYEISFDIDNINIKEVDY